MHTSSVRLRVIPGTVDQEGIQSRALFDNVWQSLTDSQDIDPDDESLLIYVKALLKIGEVLIAQQTFVSNQLAGVDEKRQFDYMQQRVLPPLFRKTLFSLPILSRSFLVDQRDLSKLNSQFVCTVFCSLWLSTAVQLCQTT